MARSGNPHPNALRARMGKKKKGRTGGLPEVKRKLWLALLHAEDILEQATADQCELRLKAMHAIAQVSCQMIKVVEVGELEVRLARLEAMGPPL